MTLMDFDKNQPLPKSHIDLSGVSDKKIHSYFIDNLDKGMYGICFSPYTEGQDIGNLLSRTQIRRRMEVIKPHTSWVRSFSCTDGNEFIPEVAKELGLSTMVGAWIGDDKKANDREMDNLVQLAQSGLVDMAVIGNEVLLREELSEAELLGYMARFREAVPNVPVAYVDAYYQFYERPSLVEASDLILINCYPFWEGCHIDHAAVYLQQMYALIQKVAQGNPIIISEPGWPNKGDAIQGAQPSDNNAMRYFAQVNAWAREEGVPLFYFSSFDESWKVHHEGDVGARWGLWDSNEQLKY
jgi:GPH family glycoside/pentoside/hexuronide:cation symporter